MVGSSVDRAGGRRVLNIKWSGPAWTGPGEEGIKYKVVGSSVDRAGGRRVLNIKWSGPAWTGPGGGGY